MKIFFTSLFEIRRQAAALLLALIALSVTDVQGQQNTAVELSVSPDSVGEADGAMLVTVTGTLTVWLQGIAGPVMLPVALPVALPLNTSVKVSVSGGTATAGTDFESVPEFTLTIVEGETSGTASFMLTPMNDADYEGDETVTVSGTAQYRDEPLPVIPKDVTIIDDEIMSTAVELSVLPDRVGEADGATPVMVTGTLDRAPLTTNTSVKVSVSGGTATAGTDFESVPEFTLTIVAGATSGTASFMLTPMNDADYEGDETVTVSGTAQYRDEPLPVIPKDVTIIDDEIMSTAVELSVLPDRVGEADGATPVMVTGTLDHAPLTTNTSVKVSVSGGTATAGTDFESVPEFTLTIVAGETTGMASFMLTPMNDADYEGDETVTVSGTAQYRDEPLPVIPKDVTIIDDEIMSTAVELSVLPDRVGEADGATPVMVTGTLDRAPLTTNTSVKVSVSGGTATAGTDFESVPEFTLTIVAGATSGDGEFHADTDERR